MRLAAVIRTAVTLLGPMTAIQQDRQPCTQIPIRILSHNIRYDAPASSRYPDELPWSTRRVRLIEELQFHTLYNPEAFICTQETLHSQLLDILSGLNSNESATEWAYIGVGRDDGATEGEYSPIFYRPNVWAMKHFETVWLSPTPEVPSKGWDAGSVRLLTAGLFTHRASGKDVLALNTHLDDSGNVSRKHSVWIIQEQIEKISVRAGHVPVFLAGDFNSEPQDYAHDFMAAGNSTVTDAKSVAGFVYGDKATYTGFTNDATHSSEIDFVFVGPKANDKWVVEDYVVVPNKFDDSGYVSDHRAVIVDVVLESEARVP